MEPVLITDKRGVPLKVGTPVAYSATSNDPRSIRCGEIIAISGPNGVGDIELKITRKGNGAAVARHPAYVFALPSPAKEP